VFNARQILDVAGQDCEALTLIRQLGRFEHKCGDRLSSFMSLFDKFGAGSANRTKYC